MNTPQPPEFMAIKKSEYNSMQKQIDSLQKQEDDDCVSKCQEIAVLRKQIDELKLDIANAVKYAKEYAPDYPWKLNTASEVMWTLGEGYKGVCQANNDLHNKIDELTKENLLLRDVLSRVACKDPYKTTKGYCCIAADALKNTTESVKQLEAKLEAGREAAEALEQIARLDKTEYDYNGKISQNRFGEKPGVGKCFKTPRDMAKEALQKCREVGMIK